MKTLTRFIKGRTYIFSCKAWLEYQKNYFEKRKEKFIYHEYEWMKLVKGKKVEIITEVSGRIFTEVGYIYVRPYGCIEIEDPKEKFEKEEIKQVDYEQLTFF